jgi:hypothetical protein
MEWVDDLNIKLTDGSECYFTHGKWQVRSKISYAYTEKMFASFIFIQNFKYNTFLILIL